MKVYQLTDKDFEALFVAIERDPKRGLSGGGGIGLTDMEIVAHNTAHRFYNYHIRKWVDGVCE